MRFGGLKILKPYLSKGEVKKISVGKGLDDILDGGVETKTITQIYGPPGVGKTNICLQCVVNCVEAGKKAAFIDTEGGHSIERIRQISKGSFEKVMENSFFYEPTSFKDQKFIIENLEQVVNKDFGLIVLDSAVSLYRLERTDENIAELNQEFSKQLAKLLDVARKFNLAIIITNQVYSKYSEREAGVSNNGVEPIGGDVLKYWSKAIMELKKDGAKGREAILRRHRSLPENLRVKFIITKEGLDVTK